ncbi:colicin V synthesis protein [Rhodospirillum rubrum]|uniref:CvpA family protein n=1 Tax=Rhodospirillum rubrum TaxID=1085 RepID=UPI001906A0E1|nr:CvpA family protein [Rhodospirillum rubrum]MBK1663745.1 colicin V synthesis protein [Rhodospirillum rubrum]MBK1676664.1 colicin V synthesis protein [Rhodospirillum rubrum]
MSGWPINPLDILVLAVLLISAALAFFRGFVHETLAVGAWAGAIVSAVYGMPLVSPLFLDLMPRFPWAADIAAAATIFLVMLLGLSILTTMVAKQVQKSALNTLDRSLGFLFGLLRGGVLLIAGYVAVSWLLPVDRQPDWMRTARSMPMIENGASSALALLPANLQARERALRNDTATVKQDAETLLDAGRSARDAQRSFDRLNSPRPEAPRSPTDSPTGYDSGERQEMNRLFESTQ